jgi:nitrogen fixation NifU-like protein
VSEILENKNYPDYIIKITEDEKYYGRLNDSTCAAYIKGICGDEMEYHIVIENNIITDARFWTSGCIASRACGIALINFIINKNIYEALSVSPACILNELQGLPEENHHCAILACLTFYKAIGEYIINYNNS